MKLQSSQYRDFYWQGGYGAFSVIPKETEIVTSNTSTQKQHHQKMTFEDEYRPFLKQYQNPNGELYVWDAALAEYHGLQTIQSNHITGNPAL